MQRVVYAFYIRFRSTHGYEWVDPWLNKTPLRVNLTDTTVELMETNKCYQQIKLSTMQHCAERNKAGTARMVGTSRTQIRLIHTSVSSIMKNQCHKDAISKSTLI